MKSILYFGKDLVHSFQLNHKDEKDKPENVVTNLNEKEIYCNRYDRQNIHKERCLDVFQDDTFSVFHLFSLFIVRSVDVN